MLTRYKRFYEEDELEEALFGINKKNCLQALAKLQKKYNKYYKMLSNLKQVGSKLVFSILYWNNHIGKHEVEITDEGIVSVSSNDEYLDFNQDGVVDFKDFIDAMQAVCNINYNKIYNNGYNDLRSRNYGSYVTVK